MIKMLWKDLQHPPRIDSAPQDSRDHASSKGCGNGSPGAVWNTTCIDKALGSAEKNEVGLIVHFMQHFSAPKTSKSKGKGKKSRQEHSSVKTLK